MSSQWLILLTFISFLHLAVNGPIYYSATDDDNENNIDTSYYYRLMNAYTGKHLALDVINDGNNYALQMAPVSSNSGQFWRFIPLGNNVYSLRTLFLKKTYSLDIVNDGINTKPHMAKTGSYSGQSWHLTPLNDGTFKLSNDFSGNDMALDIYSDNHIAHMSNTNVDYSGQHWSFHKIGKIENY